MTNRTQWLLDDLAKVKDATDVTPEVARLVPEIPVLLLKAMAEIKYLAETVDRLAEREARG
jgi:hypothetical protein